MGIVYKARQRDLRRLEAVKTIKDDALAGSKEKALFRQEAEAVARLQHPYIVQIYEFHEHEGRPYIAMEFAAGGSLDTRLGDGPLPPRDAAELVEKLARAIHYAHEQNIIHRDLKPANVLLAADGTPKITDFGLAKHLENRGSLIESGALVGTPPYMAPEQALGKTQEVGRATDVYALGAVLYQCLTGRPPFQAATMLDTLQQVITLEPVSPRRLNAAVARDLETICLKCLAKVPGERYASAAALAKELRAFLDGRPIQARPVGPLAHGLKWARRQPAVAALLGAVVGTALMGTGLVTWQWRTAVAARDAEHAQLRRAERLQVHLSLNLGQTLCEKGDIGQGMLSQADALQIALRVEPEVGPAIRANLGAWRQELHPLRELLPHPVPVGTIALSPDGATILTVGGKVARLWRTAMRGQITPPLELEHPHEIATVAFSPNDGRLVLTVCDDGTARLWDAVQGSLVRLLGEKNAGPVEVTAFAPDGRMVATGHSDGKVLLWETDSGKLLHMAGSAHVGPVLALAFSPLGKMLLTGGADRAIRSWDALNLEPAQRSFPQRGGRSGPSASARTAAGC
jgi:hypothetical protein